MRDTAQSVLTTYREFLAQGQLAYQFDPGSQRAIFHPRVLAPGSGNDDLVWRTSSGRGVVYACTVIHPRNAEAYNVVLVDMQEGFRMMSRVEGVPAEQVEIGMRVRVTIHAPADGSPPYPVFLPEAS